MQPDDLRHGTYAGAVAHWFDKEPLCPPCELADRRYRRRRQRRMLNGDTPTVPSIGSVRRFQALMAIGWRGPEIAEATGISIHTLRSIVYHDSDMVHAATAAKIDAAYRRLSMTVPDGPYANRTRMLAARRGWSPPLAWDNVDDPDETPKGTQVCSTPDCAGTIIARGLCRACYEARPRAVIPSGRLDHPTVERILGGAWRARCSPAEKAEVCRLWVERGNKLAELAALTGWRPDRYYKKKDAA